MIILQMLQQNKDRNQVSQTLKYCILKSSKLDLNTF